MAIKTKRICSGAYDVSNAVRDGGYVVSINFRPDLQGWIAAANWDRHLYTDAVPTLRDAKRNARQMIEDAIQDDSRRTLARTAMLKDMIRWDTGCSG